MHITLVGWVISTNGKLQARAMNIFSLFSLFFTSPIPFCWLIFETFSVSYLCPIFFFLLSRFCTLSLVPDARWTWINFYIKFLWCWNFSFSLLSNFTWTFFFLPFYLPRLKVSCKRLFFSLNSHSTDDKLVIQDESPSRWWRCFDYFSIRQKSLRISISFRNSSIAANAGGTSLR